MYFGGRLQLLLLLLLLLPPVLRLQLLMHSADDVRVQVRVGQNIDDEHIIFDVWEWHKGAENQQVLYVSSVSKFIFSRACVRVRVRVCTRAWRSCSLLEEAWRCCVT